MAEKMEYAPRKKPEIFSLVPTRLPVEKQPEPTQQLIDLQKGELFGQISQYMSGNYENNNAFKASHAAGIARKAPNPELLFKNAASELAGALNGLTQKPEKYVKA